MTTSLKDKSEVYPRLSITDFVKNEKQFTLFVLGYSAMQNLSKDDLSSYYQVAGIHGKFFDFPRSK